MAWRLFRASPGGPRGYFMFFQRVGGLFFGPCVRKSGTHLGPILRKLEPIVSLFQAHPGGRRPVSGPFGTSPAGRGPSEGSQS